MADWHLAGGLGGGGGGGPMALGGGTIMLNKEGGLVHAEFECVHCGWVSTNYKNAQATAAIHAEAHGHQVRGEVGLSYEYTGEPK
jgi:hypothetical protein